MYNYFSIFNSVYIIVKIINRCYVSDDIDLIYLKVIVVKT